MKMQQRVLMVSIQWADTEEAQNSYAFFRSPASVSCEALIQFKLLSSNCAKTMQDFKYISIKPTFDMQIYLINSYQLIKKIEGSLIY